jgi:NADH-quinone oxidoreductase subunit E
MNLEEKKKVIEIINQHREEKGSLIPVLQKVQDIIGYLPEEILSLIAKELNIPFSHIYGVVTFYAQFYLTPRGKYAIKACRGTACHVRGAKKIISTIKEVTGLEEGETSPDLKFTFDTISCIGACALAPLMMINKDYFGNMTPKKTVTILNQYKNS